jgi:hypothetical protein
LPRGDEDNQQGNRSPGTFQEEERVINIIFGGSVCHPASAASSCTTVTSTRCSGTRLSPFASWRSRITFDRRDHWVHLPRPSVTPSW